jgi:hypothetical protein
MKYTTYIIHVSRYLYPHLKQMKVAIASVLKSNTTLYCYYTQAYYKLLRAITDQTRQKC